jgi:DNA mismatch endonuclease (patch repair protein)
MAQGRIRRQLRSPSFVGLRPSSLTASRAKQSNRATDTSAELILRRTIWRLGLRFRTHLSSLPGRPDIVFGGSKVVVFCDGDFWHGRHWRSRQAKLAGGANSEYWLAKLSANRRRDRRNNRLLKALGWHVVRLWETDVKRRPETAARRVQRAIRILAPRKE